MTSLKSSERRRLTAKIVKITKFAFSGVGLMLLTSMSCSSPLPFFYFSDTNLKPNLQPMLHQLNFNWIWYTPIPCIRLITPSMNLVFKDLIDFLSTNWCYLLTPSRLFQLNVALGITLGGHVNQMICKRRFNIIFIEYEALAWIKGLRLKKKWYIQRLVMNNQINSILIFQIDISQMVVFEVIKLWNNRDD